MDQVNGAQTVKLIPGRNIILSAGVGKTNIDELLWLTDTILRQARAFKSQGWAYIADCSKMQPVTAAEGGQLVKLTKAFVAAGCKAFAFIDDEKEVLKRQSQNNTERADTGVLEGHFFVIEDALEWIQNNTYI